MNSPDQDHQHPPYNLGTTAREDRVSINTSIHEIRVSEDKLRLALTSYIDQITAKGRWTTPLGIFLTTILTLSTAKFQELLGLDENVWKAIFIVVAVVSIVWLIASVWTSLKGPSLDELVQEISGKEKN